jgi:sulfopyruvate decarboxylase alpha subunit
MEALLKNNEWMTRDVRRRRRDYRRYGINSITNRHSCFNHKAKVVRRGPIYTLAQHIGESVMVLTNRHDTAPGVRVQNESADLDWPLEVYRQLKAADVRHVTYVPDAGHSRLIDLLNHDPQIVTSVLTTEEEGIAIAAGAWLGGQRSAILMQSSGVGNCINALSLPAIGRFPLLIFVTMRGEWAEFNPWQMPMGAAAEPSLHAIGVRTVRAETAPELLAVTASAIALAYGADQQMAVIISQRLLGSKKW